MDRLSFFKHGLGRIMETAQSIIGLGQAVNTFTEVVDEALSEIKSDMGLHLPTLDALVYENAEQALRELSQAGYTAIEVGSYFFGKVHYKTPEEFRALADKYGLKITSAHVHHLYELPAAQSEEANEGEGDELTNEAQTTEQDCGAAVVEAKGAKTQESTNPNDEWWKEAIRAHKILGCKYITMQRMPEQMTRQDAELYAEYFNRIGELALEEGMRFQFHPTSEILETKIDGESLMDIIMAGCDAEKVWLQIDTLECLMANVDCLSLLQKYEGRVLTMHLHDRGTAGESGEIDFEKLISKAIKLKVEELYVEVNSFSLPPMNCVERSINYMLSLPSVRY